MKTRKKESGFIEAPTMGYQAARAALSRKALGKRDMEVGKKTR